MSKNVTSKFPSVHRVIGGIQLAPTIFATSSANNFTPTHTRMTMTTR